MARRERERERERRATRQERELDERDARAKERPLTSGQTKKARSESDRHCE